MVACKFVRKGIAMELTEPDAKGRRGVKEMPGSEFTMDVDTIIIAIGQTPNPIIQRTTDGLQSDPRHGTICVNEVGKTSLDGVYAGGDVTSGGGTVIEAIANGQRAACSIDRYLGGKGQLPPDVTFSLRRPTEEATMASTEPRTIACSPSPAKTAAASQPRSVGAWT